MPNIFKSSKHGIFDIIQRCIILNSFASIGHFDLVIDTFLKEVSKVPHQDSYKASAS